MAEDKKAETTPEEIQARCAGMWQATYGPAAATNFRAAAIAMAMEIGGTGSEELANASISVASYFVAKEAVAQGVGVMKNQRIPREERSSRRSSPTRTSPARCLLFSGPRGDLPRFLGAKEKPI